MLVQSYLPPFDTLSEKMKKLLEPQFPTRAAMEIKAMELAGQGGQSSGSTVVDPEDAAIPRKCLATREKRFMHEVWALNGQFYKGSHFPSVISLCVSSQTTLASVLKLHSIGARKSHEKPEGKEKRHPDRSRGRMGMGAEQVWVLNLHLWSCRHMDVE